MACASSDGGCTRPLTGRAVLICLIAFFAVISIANGIMIRAAVTTFGGVETASSYQAGLAFARESAAAHAQDELRWKIKTKVRPSNGSTSVNVDARDAQGRPLAGLQATALLAHPTDRRADQTVLLNEGPSGQFYGTARAIIGQWDLIIELSRDGARVFRSRNRVVLN